MHIVIGAGGMLGREVVRCLRERGIPMWTPTIEELDITDPQCARAPEFAKASVVINCSAYTDVAGAEKAVDEAFRLNRDAITHLTQALAGSDARLIHVSTDFVFDGTATHPYDERAVTRPLQVYGRSKREGEQILEASSIPWLCIRTAWLFGHGKRTFVSAIRDAAQRNGTVRVVTDEIGTPSYAPDIAEALIALMDKGAQGMYHATNTGIVSRYDFAKAILQQAGIAATVEPIRVADVPSTVVRPSYSALDCKRLEQTLGYRLRPWADALNAYFAREAKENTPNG